MSFMRCVQNDLTTEKGKRDEVQRAKDELTSQVCVGGRGLHSFALP